MRAVKAVKQNYSPSNDLLGLIESFRCMINDCVRIGLENNTTSMKGLSLKAYRQLEGYEVMSYYKLTAISKAAGILANYRKAKRKGKRVKEPYASRPQLVSCYGIKIANGTLVLPMKETSAIQIPLTQHSLTVLAKFDVRSVTLTARNFSISYAKTVTETVPHGLIGVDRNLNNVTTADSEGHVQQLDLSEATQVKAQYREIKRHMKRNDVRVRRRVYSKYGELQRNRVQQILHHASKLIVQQAREHQHGIVMENIRNIRRLYRKGNWQGRKYRSVMNGWSYAELQRQIEYKARWEGLPVIYVPPQGTSVNCSICGSRMNPCKPEENRQLKCLSCGFTVDRDVNAARNILARGMRFMPVAPQVEAMVSVFNPPVDCGELTSEAQQ